MRRHWSQRVGATLFAIWFAIVGFEPGALGACPMHQTAGGMLAGGAVATAPANHAEHAEHAEHASHAAHANHSEAHGEHHSAPAEEQEHHCTCPGSCSATALAVPATPATVAHVATFTTTHVAPELGLRAAWTDFVLPFATAPPAHALA